MIAIQHAFSTLVVRLMDSLLLLHNTSLRLQVVEPLSKETSDIKTNRTFKRWRLYLNSIPVIWCCLVRIGALSRRKESKHLFEAFKYVRLRSILLSSRFAEGCRQTTGLCAAKCCQIELIFFIYICWKRHWYTVMS